MRPSSLLLLIVLAGAGTFLIRLLPMLWQAKTRKGYRRRDRLRNALEAIGPSAIVALLAVSLWEMIAAHVSPQSSVPVAVGLLGVWLGKRVLGSIAWATLSGVLAYGLTLWLLTISL